MRAVRSVNNNIAVCVDSVGNELIAMGKGIGYGKLPREISLDDVSHTYYNVDTSVLAGIAAIPGEVLSFAAALADRARSELPYQMSPNLVFTLADHISFAIKRASQNLRIAMPLAFDVEQSYPTEYRIARQALRRLRREFKVALADDEAAGIALNFVNSKVSAASETEHERTRADEDMLEDITEIVENCFGLTVDRTSFAFSRYATHLGYLFHRLHEGKPLTGSNLELYADVRRDYPEVEACVGRIAEHLRNEWGAEVTDEERLYILIHVNRLSAKDQSR